MKLKYCLLLLLCPALSYAQQPPSITGIVINSRGEPLVQAHVQLVHAGQHTSTSASGNFGFMAATLPDTLLVAHVGYVVQRYLVTETGKNNMVIVLNEAINQLDETLVIAYGKTSRRLNTGNVGRISAAVIAAQPVNDPLLVMQGRIAGVTVTQTSGNPGSSVQVQIRGRNSIAQGSDPLFIIDGVPFAPGNTTVNKLTSQLNGGNSTGLSPFFTLNPADIESIEVLKDADATAIYGSRGANGVVLITTKKGRAGPTSLQVNVSEQWSSANHLLPMMDTKQYMAMRREAFANDGTIPTITTAPDLLLFDSSRYTNYADYFYGGIAKTTNAQLSITGGIGTTGFRISSNYRTEGTVVPGDMHNQRMGGEAGIDHRSANNRFNLGAALSYNYSQNKITSGTPGNNLKLPPHFPDFWDSTGNLSWQYQGYSFTNPLAYKLTRYTAQNNYYNARVLMDWRLLPPIKLSVSAGYNRFTTDETSVTPIAAQNPANGPLGTLNIAQSAYQGWIIEPQAAYQLLLAGGKLTLLTGAALQNSTSQYLQVQGSGYASDDLLQSIAAAPAISARRNSFIRYRYEALFARINYNYQDKYIINVSGRRDGSSRFGPGYRFSNFGALGMAWLFSNERFIKKAWGLLSYGKIRASYGTTGNDQIGDYNYLDNWSATTAYNGTATLYPVNLFNALFRWELNKKLEAALELGFLHDRILFTASWYRNRSGNQLVPYKLPAQTGFNSLLRNLPAVVENTGLELELTTRQINNSKVQWTTSFNLSLPKNKLVAFPGLETSSYSTTYVTGQPLSVIYRLHALGVDAATGLFVFDDIDKNGTIATGNDYVVNGHTGPICTGGLQNEFRYGGFQLAVFLDFRKQTGNNIYSSIYQSTNLPGTMNNMPALLNERWQKTGDVFNIQRLSAGTGSAAARAAANFLMSDGVYSDASFIRLKNIAVSYNLPPLILKRLAITTANVYLQCQNVFTITHYTGNDPETQDLYVLPPLRTLELGLRLGLQ